MLKRIIFCLFVATYSYAEVDLKKELSSLETFGDKKLNVDEKVDLVLIDFWASWCEPCKDSFPYYEEKIKSIKNKKILFISVNLDEKIEKAKIFLKEHPQTHITIWDEKKNLMNLLGFESIPYLIILDKDWKEKEKIRGFNDKTKKKLSRHFQ